MLKSQTELLQERTVKALYSATKERVKERVLHGDTDKYFELLYKEKELMGISIPDCKKPYQTYYMTAAE
ncbi:MAG: hypothetical protein ACRC0J_05805 [Shewanella oncorhynchi]